MLWPEASHEAPIYNLLNLQVRHPQTTAEQMNFHYGHFVIKI